MESRGGGGEGGRKRESGGGAIPEATLSVTTRTTICIRLGSS